MKYLFALIVLLFFCGCPDDGVQPPANPLQLMVEDASCTEAFLKLSLSASETNRTLILKRNDSLIAAITMAGNDSLFIDEGLLPGQTYTYTLANQNFGATAQATTMDTTSHEWKWTVETLGLSPSYL